jgi:hypothetical protein
MRWSDVSWIPHVPMHVPRSKIRWVVEKAITKFYNLVADILPKWQQELGSIHRK